MSDVDPFVPVLAVSAFCWHSACKNIRCCSSIVCCKFAMFVYIVSLPGSAAGVRPFAVSARKVVQTENRGEIVRRCNVVTVVVRGRQNEVLIKV